MNGGTVLRQVGEMKTSAALSSSTFLVSHDLSAAAPEARLHPQMPRRYALGVASTHIMRSVFGVALAVHDSDPSGRKPALVCCHAIGHGGGDFAEMERALGDRYRFITLDWP